MDLDLPVAVILPDLPLAARAAIIVGAAIAVGLVVHMVAFLTLRRFAGRTDTAIDDQVATQARAPMIILFPLLAVYLGLPLLEAREEEIAIIRHAMSIALIVGVGWLALRVLNIATETWLARYDITEPNNLQARKVQTQVRVLRRLATALVLVLIVAAALMTFDRVRELGTSLLASAGIAGIVLGIASQKTLGNFIAGIQIAISQPIRIDDVVIVEGEWGRIEEITMTYVVVRIWDKRRLIVPIGYFVEKPFENWTRVSSDLLGTVLLWVDYSVPVEEVRQAFKRILDEDGRWDGEVWGLVVIDNNERAVQLRALLSAPDAGTAFDLRCMVRERLIAWINEHYPGSLPRVRADVGGEAIEQMAAGGNGVHRGGRPEEGPAAHRPTTTREDH